MRTGRNEYWIPGVLIAVSLLVGIGSLLVPRPAGAFWPFSVTLASENGAENPMVHDSSIDLLAAAVNSDPNPSKGTNSISTTGGSALLAFTGPDGTIADISTGGSTVGSGSITTYTVKEGDSISTIADSFGVSVNTILWANNLTAKSAIKAGMNLVILPVSGIQHTVIKGETLASMAKKYGADADDIASFNGLDSGAALTAGSLLIIPGGEAPAPAATTKSSTTKIKTGGGLTSIKANPYKGGSGVEIDGYYSNPVPGALLTQGIHGWNGVDLGAPSGTPIHAAAGGTVIVSRVGGWNGGYGNYVVIDHGNGTQTLYAHMSTDSVSVGQAVGRGDVIGSVGRTGEATGNHLHFEVRGARNPFAGCSEMTHCSPQ